MKSFLLIFLATLLVQSLAFAPVALSQGVSVSASVTDNTVGTEESLSYRVEIQGASASDVQRPSPPDAEGLALLQTIPSTQNSVSIINGKMSQSIAYEWTFRPVGEGQAQIGSVDVTVKGKAYKTKPVTINVVPQSQRPQRRTARRNLLDPFGSRPAAPQEEPEKSQIGDRDIFIRALPSARRVVQNEQVNIEYHLYFREGMQLRQSRLADSWDAEGFWREELDVERRPIPKTAVENGLRYNTIVLKKVAVFPTRTGTLRIDPLRIEAEAFFPNRSMDPFDQFFSFRPRYEPVEVASSPVTVEVSALPPNAPESFTGAVGTFRMEASVDQAEVEVGEPIQVALKITGTGNIATIESPRFDPPGVFELYDPEVNTSIERKGNRIRGVKTLTYVVVPRSNGTFQIPEIEFTYFNPEHGRYESINPRPTPVKVTGTPTAPVAALTSTSGLPVDDIAGLLTETVTWKRTGSLPLHRRAWLYVLLILPLMALVGLFVYQQYQSRIAGDITLARNKRAHPVARKHLKQAEVLLAANDARAFYHEIERAVLSFVGNRLNVAEKGLTHKQLNQLLQQKDVPADARNGLFGLLQECDRVRFAPILPDQAAMDTACDRAGAIIVQLDEILATG